MNDELAKKLETWNYQAAVKSTTTNFIPADESSAWKWLSSVISRTLIL